MRIVISDEDLKNLPEKYIYYFYSTWMPKSIGSHMFRMLKKETEIPIYAFDVESFKSKLKIYEIERVPTLVFISGGNIQSKTEGYMLSATFRTLVRELQEGK